MRVRGTASSMLGIAHETSWETSQEYSGASSHTLGDPSEVLGRLTSVLGRAHICPLLAQPTTWVRRPSTAAAPPEHSYRVSRAPCRRSQYLSRRIPTLLSVLPSSLVSPPSISCRPTQVPRSLSREVHRLSRALLCGLRATDVSAPSPFIAGPDHVRGAARSSCVATQVPSSRSQVPSWGSEGAPWGLPLPFQPQRRC